MRGYLQNTPERMYDPGYHQSGFPATSPLVESLIKENNYRVKRTEKYWNQSVAECEQAVRAAVLSDDD